MSEWEEVEGDWRKLRNEELHDLYSPGIVQIIKINKNEMGRECGTNGKKRNVIRLLVLDPAGTNVLGKCKSRWKSIIKYTFKK